MRLRDTLVGARKRRITSKGVMRLIRLRMGLHMFEAPNQIPGCMNPTIGPDSPVSLGLRSIHPVR